MNYSVVLDYFCTINQYQGDNVRILSLTQGTAKEIEWNPTGTLS